MDLQQIERALDARLPSGASMVAAYVDVLLQRCEEWDGCVLVAEADDGAQLGIASVFAHVPSTDADEPVGTYALLKDLVVHPRHRGRGVGRALLDAAESFASQRGAEVLRLEVMAGNARATAFYRVHDYRPRVLQLEKRLTGTDGQEGAGAGPGQRGSANAGEQSCGRVQSVHTLSWHRFMRRRCCAPGRSRSIEEYAKCCAGDGCGGGGHSSAGLLT